MVSGKMGHSLGKLPRGGLAPSSTGAEAALVCSGSCVKVLDFDLLAAVGINKVRGARFLCKSKQLVMCLELLLCGEWRFWELGVTWL